MGLRLPESPTFEAPPTGGSLLGWGARLAASLSKFARETVDALKVLDGREPVYVPLVFRTAATAALTYPLLVPNPLAREPASVALAQVSAPVPTAALQPIWSMDGSGQIRIDSFVYFAADTRYELTLEIR